MYSIFFPVVGSMIVFMNSWKVDPLVFYTCILLSAVVFRKNALTMSACNAFDLFLVG